MTSVNLTELRRLIEARENDPRDRGAMYGALPLLVDAVEAAQADLLEHDEALLVGGSGDFYRLRESLVPFAGPGEPA